MAVRQAVSLWSLAKFVPALLEFVNLFPDYLIFINNFLNRAFIDVTKINVPDVTQTYNSLVILC